MEHHEEMSNEKSLLQFSFDCDLGLSEFTDADFDLGLPEISLN